jgi:hypothetical protein
MSDILKTITILTENGPVVINESDYDSSVHVLPMDADALAAKEAADALAAVAPVQKLVAKKGKTFIIVDSNGNQLVDTPFATEADAWNAIIS